MRYLLKSTPDDKNAPRGFHSLGDAAIGGAEAGILAEVAAPVSTAGPAFGDTAHRAARGLYSGDAVAAHGRTCELGGITLEILYSRGANTS